MQTEKGCPFCGTNSVRVLEDKIDLDKPLGFQVECINCGSRGPTGMVNQNSALSAWNNGDIGFKRLN